VTAAGAPVIRLLSPVDERYLTSAVAWAALVPTASVVIRGSRLRRPDGTLDPAPLVERMQEVVRRVPGMRQQLSPGVLGLHAPAWIPETGPVADHVSASPAVLPADLPARVMAGLDRPPLPADRSPWEIRLTAIDDGGVLMVLRNHHVIGDGMFGRAALSEVLRDDLHGDDATPVHPPLPRSFTSRVGLTVAVARSAVVAAGGPLRALVRAAREPGAGKRLRRVVGRNLRPARNLLLERSSAGTSMLDRRTAARVQLDLAAARRFARKCDASLGDVVTGLLAVAIAELHPEKQVVRILLPIAVRRSADELTGNQVRVLRADVPAGSDLPTAVAVVRDTVARAKAADSYPPVPQGSWDAYATYLPLPPRMPPVFGGVAEQFLLWPAMDPRERYAVLATSFVGRLELALAAGPDQDADTLGGAVLRAAAPLRAPAEAQTREGVTTHVAP
jgi:diacylglycerol O-acyltransferase / wax synthase